MFKEKLMGKLHKKGAKELDPMEKKAKMDVVKSLSEQAGAMMGDKMKGMGKVTVASNSPDGLHKGLQKADEMLQHPAGKEGLAGHTGSPAEGSPEEEASESHAEALAEGDLGPEGSDAEEAAESPKEESEEELAAEHADHSPEELDAKIQKLLALKHKKEAGHA